MTNPLSPFLNNNNGDTQTRRTAPLDPLATPFPSAPPLPLQGQGAEEVVSELDRWAMRHYGVPADQLQDDGLADLATHIAKLAEEEGQAWSPNRDRMKEDHSVVVLSSPKGALGHEEKTAEEKEAAGVQLVVLPDPWLFTQKVVNTLTAPGITIRKPSQSLNDMTKAQQVESALYWWWREWKYRQMHTRQGAPDRRMFQHAVVRGWECILTMPDSANRAFPWDFRVVDPLQVYPLWDHRCLVRVIRQYDVTVAQARREAFLTAEAEELLEGYKSEDTVTIIGYYDAQYHTAVLNGKPAAGTATMSNPNGAPDRRMLKPPLRHGVRDAFGTPQVPWIIVLPLGDLSEGMEDDGDSVKLVGPSILFGLHDVYNEICRLTSMLLTNVALSTTPPVIHYIDMANPEPRPLTYQPNAVNVAVYNREKYDVLNPTPNPINLQPLMELLQDRMNKATVPSAFWGSAFSGTSGYAISLLNNAARDVLLPFIEAHKATLRLLFRRALDIYRWTLADTIGPLEFAAPVEGFSRRVMGMKLEPALINELGTEVEVEFGQITPQDEAVMASYLVQLVTTGLLSRYTAREKWGIQDPMLEEKRLFRESLLQNPQVATLIGPTAAQELSDDDLIRVVVNGILQQAQAQAQEAQRLQAEAQRQAGGSLPGALPTSTLPLEQQAGQRAGVPPPTQNPQDQQNRMIGELLARLSGGSQPAP